MKKELGGKNCLYPMPVTLVGANVNGKPSYITSAHVGIMDFSHICLSMGKIHHANEGIKDNGTFTVNIPSTRLVKETDYRGLASERKSDNGAPFNAFYGKLETAPMILECPLNMECRLVNTVDMPNHDIFIGEIVESYCDEEYLVEGSVDFSRVNPIIFAMYSPFYFRLGEQFARAWNVGKEPKN